MANGIKTATIAKKFVSFGLIAAQLMSSVAFASGDGRLSLPFTKFSSEEGGQGYPVDNGLSSQASMRDTFSDNHPILMWTESLWDAPARPRFTPTDPSLADAVILYPAKGEGKNGGLHEIVSKIPIRDYARPEDTYGREALETLAKDDSRLTEVRCGCVVHRAGEDGKAHNIGTIYAQGLNATMAYSIAANGCLNTVRQESLLGAEWVAAHSCQVSSFRVEDDIRNDIRAAVAQLKEIERQRQDAQALSFVRKATGILLSGLMGGVFWRARGGGFVSMPGTQIARLLFVGVGFSLIGYLEGGRDGAIAGALMLPAVFIGYSENMDLSNGNRMQKTSAMAARGSLQTLLPALYLGSQGYDPKPLLFGGAMMGPCYAATAKYMQGATVNGGMFGKAFDGVTSWGEFCSGITFGAGLAWALSTRGEKVGPVNISKGAHELGLPDFKNLPEEDTIVLYEDARGETKPTPPARKGNARLAKICQAYSRDDFGFNRPGLAALRDLFWADFDIRQLFGDPIGDVDSVLVNHYQEACGLVGVRRVGPSSPMR
jgi:hypothetical protein